MSESKTNSADLLKHLEKAAAEWHSATIFDDAGKVLASTVDTDEEELT